MRADEEIAKQAFDRFLEGKAVSERNWRDGDEPPDFYLTASGEDFAVEVTTLIETVQTPRTEVSRIGVDRGVESFVKQIEKDALDEGLGGAYYVSFPMVQVDYYPVRQPLKERILARIRDSQSVSNLASEAIVIDDVKYCSIQKTDKPVDRVVIGFYPSDARGQGQASSEACALLQGAITEKKMRLRGLSSSKILILNDMYSFVDHASYYKRCLPMLNDLDAFHTIFVVDKETSSKDCVIYTVEPNWQ